MAMFLRRVKDYSVNEFAEGGTDADVVRRLRQKGAPVLVKFHVEDHYLNYLGVSPWHRKAARIGSAVVGMAFFYWASSYENLGFTGNSMTTNRALLVIILPMLLAMILAYFLEALLKAVWKRRASRGSAARASR